MEIMETCSTAHRIHQFSRYSEINRGSLDPHIDWADSLSVRLPLKRAPAAKGVQKAFKESLNDVHDAVRRKIQKVRVITIMTASTLFNSQKVYIIIPLP
jgi:hypothetical protein